MSEQIEGIDFAVAAYREEGEWQVVELVHDVLTDVERLSAALRRFPGATHEHREQHGDEHVGDDGGHTRRRDVGHRIGREERDADGSYEQCEAESDSALPEQDLAVGLFYSEGLRTKVRQGLVI